MNILVIGNGFDLAHGLPTKYTDFLDWIRLIRKIDELGNECNCHRIINEIFYNGFEYKYNIKKLFLKLKRDDKELKKLLVLCKDNAWIDYFCNDLFLESNWIDFEHEISKVIQSFDKEKIKLKQHITKLKNEYMNNIFHSDKYLMDELKVIEYQKESDYVKSKIAPTFEMVINVLKRDLSKFIRLFEIYISYVEEEKIVKILPDIINMHVDNVVSFNYTDTFKKIYGKDKDIEYDFIHGKADINNTIESNNMVLGIDEYLSKKRRDKDLEFIAFKKFYQRIYKQTGCKYKEWVEKIVEDENKKPWIINKLDCSKDYMHNIFIFGHSLDVTDKDILRDLILHDNVHTTIFYHNKEELGKKIANLVKVIGQEELIKRTGGSTSTIEFKQQQDMQEQK